MLEETGLGAVKFGMTLAEASRATGQPIVELPECFGAAVAEGGPPDVWFGVRDGRVVNNGLRLADSLAHQDDVVVRVFLIGDAVGCAVRDQKVPNGYYHLDRMIGGAARHGAEVGCCGTCLDARGLTDEMLTDGARRSTLDELTHWVLWADRTITL